MSTNARKSANSKQDILDAAQRIVARNGASHLTIDAVAREAGLSKGGVLYNFPTKEKLLEGMLERLHETVLELEVEKGRALEGQPNPILRKTLSCAGEAKSRLEAGLGLAIMAAAAQKPDLLNIARKTRQERWDQIEKECDDILLATVLMAAVDGMTLASLMNMPLFPLEDPDTFLAKLDSLATGI